MFFSIDLNITTFRDSREKIRKGSDMGKSKSVERANGQKISTWIVLCTFSPCTVLSATHFNPKSTIFYACVDAVTVEVRFHSMLRVTSY
jgi:hypothetical protein